MQYLHANELIRTFRRKIAFTLTSISGAKVKSDIVAVVDVFHADVHDD